MEAQTSTGFNRRPWVQEVLRLRGDARKLRHTMEHLIRAVHTMDDGVIANAVARAQRSLLETRD